jgi:aryl-alcohol dehydrogenase-like predicted oxidoreductase
MGCLAIGGSWGPTDDAESIRALRRARELGINFFDSADSYGRGKSEELIAKAFQGNLEGLVIATKGGNDIYTEPFKPFPYRKNFAAKYLEFALDKSLERLKRDTVELYQLHNPPPEVIQSGQVFEALERFKEKGKIKYYGVSIGRNGRGTPEEGLMALSKTGVSSLQAVYNIIEQENARELFPAAKRGSVAIIARVPLASGLLTGKYNRDTVFPEGDNRRGWPRAALVHNISKLEKLDFLAQTPSLTLAQAALRFVLADDAVSVVIPGARTVQQVEENAAASDGRLSEEELNRISDLYQNDFYLD